MRSDVLCNINSYASDLRKRADQDYITARMCYFHGLNENFLWNAQQCVEKYLKSIGLFHKIDVKNQGHKLRPLFSKINKSLKIGCVEIYWPQKIDGTIFIEETFENFLERLTGLGINRYCSYGWTTYGDELVKIDAVVAIIRRYCRPLGGSLVNMEKPSQKDMKRCIDTGCDYTHVTSSFLNNRSDKKLRDWLIEGNFYLCDQDDKEIKIRMNSAAVNHIITRRYNDSKEGNAEQKKTFIEFSEYLLDHIYWPNEVRTELEELIRSTYKQLINQASEVSASPEF